MKKPPGNFEQFSGKIYPSGVAGHQVHVKRARTWNGKAILTAYPVDEDTHARVADFATLRHVVSSPKQWKEEAQRMVGRVDKKLRQTNQGGSVGPRAKPSVGLLMGAYLSVENPRTLCNAEWAPSTKKTTLSDAEFAFSYIDGLDIGLEVCPADTVEVQDKFVERAMTNTRSSKNLAIIMKGIKTRLNRVDTVYRNLRQRFTDYPLPDLNFSLANFVLAIQPEQMKALPDEIRVKLAAALMQRINDGCALGAGLMLTIGPRTGEAAAVYFRDLVIDGAYCSLPILRQQGEKGATTDYLKSEAGYRVLPLPYYMVALIEKRMAYLRGLGFSDEQILEMPLVAHDKNPGKMAPSQKLSAYIKALLIECGLTNEYMLAAQELQANEPDNDQNGKPLDVAAYVLRRDFATRACNICAFAPYEVDYLLGHRNKANEGRDFQTPQAQRRMGQLLENYVLHPGYSRHPAYAPAKVPKDGSLHLEKAAQVVIEATEDVTLRIHLQCCEPNCGIKLESGQALLWDDVDTRYQKDTPAKRCGRTLIGRIPDKHQLDAWSQVASGTAAPVLDGDSNYDDTEKNFPWDAL